MDLQSYEGNWNHLGLTMIDALGKSKPTFGNGESNYLYSLNWKIETVQKRKALLRVMGALCMCES
jgi:hypothetical protein